MSRPLPLRLRHTALLSLSLHALLLSPWWLGWPLSQRPKPDKQPLIIELSGLVTKQQSADSTQGNTVTTPTTAAQQTPPPNPTVHVSSSPPVTEKITSEQPSPVQQKKHVAVPPIQQQAPKQALTQPSAPTADAQPADKQGQHHNRQQTRLAQKKPDMDVLQRYLAQLKKAIQQHLIYPEEARQARQAGFPVVSFRLNSQGEIEPGSLHIQRSSGYPLLDRKALEAAASGSPFAAPPAGMKVAIGVSFSATTD